jgi:hypothetical protein
MKWDLHIYDPKTKSTKTHVRDYPGTTKSDGAAVTAYASHDLHKHMKYILAVPHSGK